VTPTRLVRWACHSPRRLGAIGVAALTLLLGVAFVVGGARPVGGAAVAAPPSSGTSTPAVPGSAATPAPPEPDDYGDADAGEASERAARAFLVTWSGAATAGTQQAWLDRLRPVATTDLLAGLASTDRAAVPVGPVRSLSVTGVGDHVAEYEAELAGGTRVAVLVVDEGGRWAVVDVVPAG
jgi:hypothetical protein